VRNNERIIIPVFMAKSLPATQMPDKLAVGGQKKQYPLA